MKLGPQLGKLDKLSEWEANPRTITPEAFERLKHALESDPEALEFRPLVARPDGTVIAGNMRLRALRDLGWTEAPVYVIDVDDARAREISLRDNVGYGDWVPDEVAAMIAEHRDSGGDVSLFGFDEGEVEGFMASLDEPEPADIDEVPPPPRKPRSKLGDVYELGDHRLMCGDSRDSDQVRQLVGDGPVDFIFTSPPYNAGMDYTKHDDKPKPWPVYAEFLRAVLKPWIAELGNGRAIGWNIGVNAVVHHARQLLLLEDDFGLRYHRQLVWKKLGVGVPMWHLTQKRPVARQFTPNYLHELVYILSKGPMKKGARVKLDELAQHDVFEIHAAGATRDIPNREGPRKKYGGLKRHAYKEHNAVFPVRLPLLFCNHFAAPGELVADPFAGAGTTLLACERLERRSVGMEIDPSYVDVAVERWERLSGQKAKRRRKR